MKNRPKKRPKQGPFVKIPTAADADTGRFTSINERFVCEHCGRNIPPLKAGCRNHCPACLVSKHVDEMPGDRMNPCQGLMDPVEYVLEGRKGVILVFRCRRCGALTRNKAALDDPVCPDDYDAILRLTVSPCRI